VPTGGLTDIQAKLVLCYSALLTTQDLTKGWTEPYLRHRISFRAELDLVYDTGPRLGLDWALLTTQDLTWGWTRPYDTGPRLSRDWALLRTQDFAQNVT